MRKLRYIIKTMYRVIYRPLYSNSHTSSGLLVVFQIFKIQLVKLMLVWQSSKQVISGVKSHTIAKIVVYHRYHIQKHSLTSTHLKPCSCALNSQKICYYEDRVNCGLTQQLQVISRVKSHTNAKLVTYHTEYVQKHIQAMCSCVLQDLDICVRQMINARVSEFQKSRFRAFSLKLYTIQI